MTTLFEPAYAKINLTLDVLGLRDDGFHDIKTVMQTISLRDDVEIDVGTGKPWVLTCDKEGIPCDERNLAWKAAKLFEESQVAIWAASRSASPSASPVRQASPAAAPTQPLCSAL